LSKRWIWQVVKERMFVWGLQSLWCTKIRFLSRWVEWCINERPIEWRCYILEKATTKNGNSLNNLILVYKKTTLIEFIDRPKPKLQHFVRHNFVARWQDQQFKACVKVVPFGSIISIIDFAKIYSFQVQNEVQSMHWHSF
jgi:hypothetical protein